MKAAALLLLLPSLALAQPAPGGSCSLSATCAAKKFALRAGSVLCFNTPTCTDTILASPLTLGMGYFSAAVNAGTNVAHIFDTTNALTGTTLLLSLRNAGVEQMAVTDDGRLSTTVQVLSAFVDATSQSRAATFTAITFTNPVVIQSTASDGASAIGTRIDTLSNYATAGAKLVSILNAGVEKGFFDKDGNVYGGGASNPVPVVHAAQTTSPVAMEFGRAAATAGGVLAVSFSTAFGAAPSCVCTDENAAPVVCGITTAPTTSGVTFTIGAARADTVDWHCTGAK